MSTGTAGPRNLFGPGGVSQVVRSRALVPGAALACLVALAGCGGGAVEPAAHASTTIPDDFPLSAGMGAPDEAVPTTRTGTGLRDLELCGTAPMRGLAVRDRMVADNSGGEAADTRELVLLGSAAEAGEVARTFRDLAEHCDKPGAAADVETRTDVHDSPLAPTPAAALQQTYTFDGEPGDGSTVVHVVPVGAALLVSSTYGGWTRDEADAAVEETAAPLRDAVDALAQFDDGGASS